MLWSEAQASYLAAVYSITAVVTKITDLLIMLTGRKADAPPMPILQ